MSDEQDLGTLRRWTYGWIALGVAILAVVGILLFFVAEEVESIRDNLDPAKAQVNSIQGDVRPLPDHIGDVNATLARVENETEPLAERAGRVIDNLQSIHTTLQSVEASLNQTVDLLFRTDALLVDVARSLSDVEQTLDAVASTLLTTLRLARRIDDTLEAAESLRSLGTSGIWRRVRFLNGGRFVQRENDRGLRSIRRDGVAIREAVDHVNLHLESICRDLPPLPGGEGTAPLTPLPPDSGGADQADRPDC